MNEKTKFWLLLAVLLLSIALLCIVNGALGQQVLVHP
jgi:hypothetical protein